MQEQDIIRFLSLVGEELQEFGLQRPIRLLLIGGAYMLTHIHNRDATRDVDVIILDLDPVSEEYRLFKQAVAFVAHDLGMSPAWLSDNMAQFLQSIGKVPTGKLWLSCGKLEVFVPDPSYILALKIISGREKDMNDIKALLQLLAITTRRQAEEILDLYLDKETQKNYAQDIQEALDHFFE
jgi:predicted nucleotidyltransferase